MASKSLAEIAELFFVDTTPFVDAYFLNPEGQNYDWRGISPRESYLQTTLKVFENTYIYLNHQFVGLSWRSQVPIVMCRTWRRVWENQQQSGKLWWVIMPSRVLPFMGILKSLNLYSYPSLRLNFFLLILECL